MSAPRALLALALVVAAAAPSLAQALPTPRERAEARYETKTWRAPGPSVAGWTPDGFTAPGWKRDRIRVDARKAQARIDFSRPAPVKPKGPQEELELEKGPQEKGPQEKSPKAKPHWARLTIQRHPSAAAARDVLLRHLAACTATLTREEGLGEVAFGTRVRGRLVYLAGARGDLSYTLRAGPDADVSDLAAALDAALRAGQQAKGPRTPAATLRGHAVAPAREGQPIRVKLDLAGKARATAFDAPEGASAMASGEGFLLYADQPGEVEVRVRIMDKELRVSEHRVRITR